MVFIQRDKAIKWNVILENRRKQELNIEIWMNVIGYEGIYQISSQGRVRSVNRTMTFQTDYGVQERTYKGRILVQRDDKDGYKRITLSKNGELTTFQVHRLVAEAFIPNPERKAEVNHIDMNKGNNNVFNLEWMSRQENAKHYADSRLDEKLALIEAVKENPDTHYKDLMEEFGFSQSVTYRLRRKALEQLEAE